jgi:hypothetical protein
MVDLHVLSSLDQLHFILKISLTFDKTSYLNEEVNSTKPSHSISIHCSSLPECITLKGKLRALLSVIKLFVEKILPWTKVGPLS